MQAVVDVSYHNGKINWEKVKAAGVHAIIRCGYIRNGKRVTDEQWYRNVSECVRLGIPFGAYLYSYAETATQVLYEAKFAVELCKPYQSAMRYPLFFDSEQKGTEKVAGTNATIFCNSVRNEGFTPGIYANQSWWQEYLSNVSRDYVRWVARWSKNEPVIGWKVWQYTNTGTCSGVPPTSEGGVDMNWSVLNVAEAAAWVDPDTLADDVIAGKYGNLAARKKALGDRYEVVQAIVNYRLQPKSKVTQANLEAIAKSAQMGVYGNGSERKKKLGSIYQPVQDIVNKNLSK